MFTLSEVQRVTVQAKSGLYNLRVPGFGIESGLPSSNNVTRNLGYATVVRTLLAQAHVSADRVTAIGCHGQTVRHRPESGYTYNWSTARCSPN